MSAETPIICIGDTGQHHWRPGTVAGQAVVCDAFLRPWTAGMLAHEAGALAATIRVWQAAAQAGNPAAGAILPGLWRRAASLDQARALLEGGAPAPVHQVSVDGTAERTILRCVCGAVVTCTAALWSSLWAAAVRAFVAAHPAALHPSEDDRR